MAAPARRIADNAGADGRWVVARLLDGRIRTSASMREPDASATSPRPASWIASEVVCAAFRNAVSTAGRVVLSEAAVAPVSAASA